MTRLQQILAIIGGLVLLVTSAFGFDATYTRKKETKLLAMRLEQKIQGDKRYLLTREKWSIEDRYGTAIANMPEGARERYREIKYELKKIEEENKEDK